MLNWYRIDAKTPEALANIFKSLRKQHLLVRRTDDTVYACVSTHHIGWLGNVCTDFGGTTVSLKTAPEGFRKSRREEYKTPCGEIFYDHILLAQHVKYCQKCKQGAKVEVKVAPVRGAKVVAKLEPGVSLNFDGVITSLEEMRNQLYQHLEDVEGLLKNLRGYQEAKIKMVDLTSEVKLRVQGAKILFQKLNL